MNKLTVVGALLLLLSCTVRKKTTEETWMNLFNGKDLKDWIIKIKDHPLGDNYGNTFRVQDGLLTVSYDQYSSFNKQYGHIYYKQLFSWYLLVLEYLAKLRVIAFLMVQDY